MQGAVEPPRYFPQYSPPAENQVNGGAELLENGFHPALAGVYDLLEKAESALNDKTAENDQLRAALENTQNELNILKRKPAAPIPDEIESKHVANGNAEASKQRGEESISDAPHLSPPSSRPLSPSRRVDEKPLKENMVLTKAQEESRHRSLRTSLLDAALKETQLLAEIGSLERKLAELQMLYHREQQNVADSTAKALAVREELVDKNMKLAFENHALGQERNIFVSSLLQLLEEYEFHPTTDAQSIVASVKSLVQYLKDKVSNEGKAKDSGFYRPWLLYAPPSPNAMQSPPRFVSAPSPTSNGRGLEIVPQGVYQGQRPGSPPSPLNVPGRHQNELASPLVNRINPEFVIGQENGFHNEPDDEARGYNQGLDYLKRSPHLPSLPEEPNHAASEDDDPLPAVAGLRIVGDAVLGSKLTVCGHSINGTALCNFQWIRYYPDGSPDDIDGASQTEYTLSADDCDTFLAIQCCPMDDRGRKGEQVTQFANNQNLIKCDQTLEDQINAHIMVSQAQFDVTIMDNDGTPGVLLLKRSSFEIKQNNQRIIKEKYSSDVNVRVFLGQGILCSITGSDGREHILCFKENRVRDRAVLTLRRFKQLALDGKRGKPKTWFGKKVS